MSRASLALALTILIPALAPAQAPPPGADASAAAVQAGAPAALPAPADYQIGPQDILKITVYGHEDLTQSVLVQPDGTFTFPSSAGEGLRHDPGSSRRRS